ncbi:MAG: NYN domain-containing protein [Deltaproteobacteria bacterium]|nr:MAG: NYN domain-containing protein [Deltaproteobacteria bacterium]
MNQDKTSGGDVIRSALFVDFDNIFIALRDENPKAAEEFATNPNRWVEWLVRLNWQGGFARGRRRAILLKKCYLNPGTFGKFRPYFTRAAFEVVDCPSLTGRGKNSGDIHMVLDILDTLAHPTLFDEFILLSGDADFTPVLLRLRTHDRRTVILTGGLAAQAYRAAADHVIDADRFVEEALRAAATAPASAGTLERPAGAATVSEARLRELADKLYEVATTNGEIQAPDLARDVFMRFPDFKDSNWYGFLSLRRLVDELVARRDDLEVVEEDPWYVRVRRQPSAALPPAPTAPSGPPAGDAAQVAAILEATVKRASEPVPTGVMAQAIIDRIGPGVLESEWFGYGTFRALLDRLLPDLGLEFAAEPPGYVYDPARHPTPEQASRFDRELPELASLATRLSQVTGVPRLHPEDYAALFERLAEEVREHGFQLNDTSKAVRDKLIEEGRSVSRSAVAFVVRGVRFGGLDLRTVDRSRLTAGDLASAFKHNVFNLCQGAQLELSPEEDAMLDRWFGTPANPPA